VTVVHPQSAQAWLTFIPEYSPKESGYTGSDGMAEMLEKCALSEL
jgi:hypothetical protein